MPIEHFYKRDTVITAMCIWEEMSPASRADDPWKAFREAHGAVELREVALNLAPYCNAHYEEVEFDEPFDWEFVPMWLRLCVEWPEDGGAPSAKVKSLTVAVQALGEAIWERICDRRDDWDYFEPDADTIASGGTI